MTEARAWLDRNVAVRGPSLDALGALPDGPDA